MREAQVGERLAVPASEGQATPVATPLEASPSQIVVPAQACPSCNAARAAIQPIPDPWVYVIGDVDPRSPSLAVEKEAMGAMVRASTKGLTNAQALQKVLEARGNEYLVREMCYVLLVQEVETYILVPHFAQDYPMLIEAAKSELSAVIGSRGPIAGPEVCNGLTLPILVFNMIYNFDKQALISDMPLPAGTEPTKAAEFRRAAADIFDQALPLITTGMGAERSLAMVLLKDESFYHKMWEEFNQDAQLKSIELKAASVGGLQTHFDVIVSTQSRKHGGLTSIFERVDASGKFPFVVSRWRPYLATYPGQ